MYIYIYMYIHICVLYIYIYIPTRQRAATAAYSKRKGPYRDSKLAEPLLATQTQCGREGGQA